MVVAPLLPFQNDSFQLPPERGCWFLPLCIRGTPKGFRCTVSGAEAIWGLIELHCRHLHRT